MAKNIKCSHCQLSFSEDIMLEEEIEGQKEYFCCSGCLAIYHLLKSGGLDSFYERLGNKTILPPLKYGKDIDDGLFKFDLQEVKDKFIKVDGKLSTIYLVVENISCFACVWLIEKVLKECDGIYDATINYTTSKIKISWDQNIISLSGIVKKIRYIGYDAYLYDPKIQEIKSKQKRKEYYTKLIVAVFCSMNIMWISVAHYSSYFSSMTQAIKDILNVASFILATPVLFYTGAVYFRGAYFALKNRYINMDFLVAFGSLLAYLYSVYNTLSRSGPTYFDSVVMIITFVFVGKYLEVLVRQKAGNTLDMFSKIIPDKIVLIRGNVKRIVSSSEVKIGDIIEIRPGSRLAIDGEITLGDGNFDESSLTGESSYVYKRVGDKVFAGTICVDSLINFKATKEAKNSLMSNIVSLLEDSINKKPKIEKISNIISKYFSIAILSISIISFLAWFISTGHFNNSFLIAICVVLIACPCALALATPITTVVGLDIAAKNSILFKSASFLETISKCDTLVLDKTGTLTKGKLSVVNFTKLCDFDINLLYSLSLLSTHPVSKSISAYLKKTYKELKPLKLNSFKHIQAKGVIAEYRGHKIIGGNLKFLKENDINYNYSSQKNVFAFAIDKKIYALLELEDELRSDAKMLIREATKIKLNIIILTGDTKEASLKIAKELGVKSVYSSLSPENKADIVKNLLKDGKKVIMVGDGINDILALSSSNIAIAMGGGVDIAMSASDVVLLDDNLKSLIKAIIIGRKTYAKIKENIAFSIIYNLFTIPIAISGLITPLASAISMSVSSLVVVSNSIRMKLAKYSKK